MDVDEFYHMISRQQLRDHISAATTPVYLFYGKIIERQVAAIRKCLGPRVHLHYAVKANPAPDILRTMHRLDLGADVASGGELSAVIDAGFHPASIEFSGPGKTDDELSLAVATGIGAINVENVGELHKIVEIAKRQRKRPRVGIRINPEVKSKSGLKMAGATQFGLSKADAEVALAYLEKSEAVEFVGVHIHIGSQILSPDGVVDGLRTALDMASWVRTRTRMGFDKLNFGGGWGVTYYDGQKSLDLEIVADGLDELITANESKLPGLRYICEPGRYLVAESGVYVSKVLYVKESGGKLFAIVDGGMHQNYVLAGGMGQVIRRNFHLDILPASGEAKPVAEYELDIAGCLCTPQDILARSVKWRHEVHPGDYVVFFNCGAYGLAASPSQFLSHPQPAQTLLT